LTVKESSAGPLVLKSNRPRHEPRTVIKVGSDFYIHASSLTSRRSTRVLVNGESFAVFEASGDLLETPNEPLGFFHRDTRYLSRFELKIAGETPYYLNSYITPENAQLRINLTNPDLCLDGEEIELPTSSIQIERNWVISGASLFHKLVVHNFTRRPVEIPLDFLFGTDFSDLFEVRGLKRIRRGQLADPEVASDTVTLSYLGLDGRTRSTRIRFDPVPRDLQPGRAAFLITLEPEERWEGEVRLTGECSDAAAHVQVPVGFESALRDRRGEIDRYTPGWSTITASSETLNNLLKRSAADLTSIIQYAPEGTFIMAGIPWFATLFGRDSILTAFMTLPFNPALTVGTLKTLASLQGSQFNQRRDEQPGKIVHEIRGGEMAATGEVPFGRYYGSIDSTPLFLWLLGSYATTTGDLELPAALWPNVERALEWIEKSGDRDGDLYVEYLRETPRGLANQGWKDSLDSVSHVEGDLAQPPIALCEVQGYVYAAYLAIADLAVRLGHVALAGRLEMRAGELKARFIHDFWLEEEGIVALALDANKKPCRVMSSNGGHCMATGILDREMGEALAIRLMSDEMFSGWGVRTLSTAERRYNPMSYHNGSVWPHDNAIVAAGLGRIGERRSVIRILEGLLPAETHLKGGSLPELFCGFPRDERLGPVPYPVACHPQAWSAASVFMIIRAMLGIEVLGLERKLVIESPAMPEWLDWLRIENLRVADGSVSLLIRRTPEVPAIEILEKKGAVTIEFR
jgi:glycogen debranching enzyme